MTAIYSFPPIASPDAQTLILGSIPGQASLAANQYYAHPRNPFWRIMAALLGFLPDAAYADKTRHLLRANIALWDVVASCQRPGSLDSNIDQASVIANDVPAFLADHPGINRVFFNGSTAEHSFRRLVLPQLDACSLVLQRLPSTSPAHASLSFAEKLAAWSVVLESQRD
ncbi:MAG: DNA-deoxyinosine glycosylase [Methylomonas sp.]|nr:DNA-deoxyinosine glycosylase [Methylomonas sp.]PPD22522.1 MAG: DNA-deoxyinosine glycosylase [Methylomonas sp.]PPD27836.1 MAG: DNA-deoxyinosine glycosylase [Methylomonas sp.]PPD39945.1 MAG: DNA-deoxyinosine glycosylase [Methylomonas sp.]PPD41076.1 MAG: DNA-deoxyinosine glycosylase [Methylomonas sp.]